MDFATAQVKQNGSNFHVSHGDDTNLFVEFRKEARTNIFKSEQEGRPIFEDVVYITINFPGDRTKKIDRPVTDEDKARFSRHWDAYVRNEDGQHIIGTRLEQWPILSKSEIAELKALNIFTVEQLSDVPDSALNWFGARELRTKAKAWILLAKDSAASMMFAKENDILKTEIERLKVQMNEISSEVAKNKKVRKQDD